MRILLALLAVSCWAAAAEGAARPLSDAELDRVTAGATADGNGAGQATDGNGGNGVPGDSLGGVPGAAGVTGGDPSIAAPVQDATTAIVGAGADASLAAAAAVTLSGEAQAGARAADIANGAFADIAGGVNLWAGAPGAAVDQANDVNQTTRPAAGLDHWRAGPATRATVAATARAGRTTTETTTRVAIDRTVTRSTVSTTMQARIRPETLGFGTIGLDPVELDRLGFPGGQSFGIAGARLARVVLVAPSLEGVRLDLPELDLDADRLVLTGATLSADRINLGSARVEIGRLDKDGNCVSLGGCWRGAPFQLPILDNGGKGFEIALPTTIDLGENPFADTAIPVGGGFAGIGDGVIEVDGGSIKLAGALTIELPSFKDLIADISGFDITAPNGVVGRAVVDVLNISKLEFDPFTVERTFFEREFAGFREEVSVEQGGFCFKVGTAECEISETTTKREEKRTYTGDGESRNRREETSLSERVEVSLDFVAPAELSEAEADFIAVSQGNLNVETISIVGANQTAQSNLRAGAAVNASRAVVANGMNVANVGRAASGGAALRLNQGNMFQQRR